MALRPTLFALLLAVPVSAAGQSPEPPPAHVASVEGIATLGYEPLESGTPLELGDRLQTTRGRVEIFFADGSTLYVNESTTLELLAPNVLRLTSGELTFDIPANGRRAADRPYEVRTLAGSVLLDLPGEYRVTAREGGPVPAAWDRFARWIDDRRAQARADSTSRRYLPAEVAAYGTTFDRGGYWDSEASYGAVWYPTVAPDWRPYYNGRWAWMPRTGWTWVSYDPWGWPTHHYGRWGLSVRGRWFWIPGHQWAPAWVSWAIASDYVSWCALGFDGGAVVMFPGRTRFVNDRVFERSFTVYDRIYDPDFAWTTIRSHQLGGAVPARRIAVGSRRLVERDGVPFIQQRVPPRAPRARAVPRPPAPLGEAPAASRRPAAPAAGMAVPRSPTRPPVDPRVYLAPPAVAPLAPRRVEPRETAPAQRPSTGAQLTPPGATRDAGVIHQTAPGIRQGFAIPRPPDAWVAPSAPRPQPRFGGPRAAVPRSAPPPASPRGTGRPAPSGSGWPSPSAPVQRADAPVPVGGTVPAPRQAVPRER